MQTAQEQMTQKVADAAAAASVVVASTTWITEVNGILQLVATAVAIIAGLCAARYHWVKTRQLRDDKDE